MSPEELSAADDRLHVAREAAEEAGRFSLSLFRKPLVSRFKRGDSMVSEADQAAEEAIVKRIARAFPADLILGEEGGLTPGDSGWSWTLDPLDGTQNFLAGVPLLRGGDRGASMTRCRSWRWSTTRSRARSTPHQRGGARAGRGRDSRSSREPLGPHHSLRSATGSLRREGQRIDDLLPTRKFRSLGSMSLELAYVAQGSIHLLLANRPHLWDVAPGMLLVEEAGGVMRSFEGDPIFPLPEDMPRAAERRYQVMAGGPAAVESGASRTCALWHSALRQCCGGSPERAIAPEPRSFWSPSASSRSSTSPSRWLVDMATGVVLLGHVRGFIFHVVIGVRIVVPRRIRPSRRPRRSFIGRRVDRREVTLDLAHRHRLEHQDLAARVWHHSISAGSPMICSTPSAIVHSSRIWESLSTGEFRRFFGTGTIPEAETMTSLVTMRL